MPVELPRLRRDALTVFLENGIHQKWRNEISPSLDEARTAISSICPEVTRDDVERLAHGAVMRSLIQDLQLGKNEREYANLRTKDGTRRFRMFVFDDDLRALQDAYGLRWTNGYLPKMVFARYLHLDKEGTSFAKLTLDEFRRLTGCDIEL